MTDQENKIDNQNNKLNKIPEDQDQNRIIGLKKMRRKAGGLLLIMSISFLIITYLINHYNLGTFTFWGYLKSFAEAAMVGGIADWFAVTALFRHPLGLPIPHTAIIPNKQEAIGESLGNFVENKFLTPDVLESKLQKLEITKRLEEWLSNPQNTVMIAENLAQIIPAVLNALDDEEVRDFIENSIFEKVQGNKVADVVGNLLTVLMANRKHDELFNELIKIADRLILENKEVIRKKIKEESPWFVPGFINENISKRVIVNLDHTIDQVSTDPNHPLRKKFYHAVEQFINDLRNSPDLHHKIDELKKELLENPTVDAYLNQLWADLKQYILDNISNPDSQMRKQIHESIYVFCAELMSDENLRQKISMWIYNTILGLVNKYRSSIKEIISETMKSWKPEKMTEELELYVGKDLQYIRISGTLVGGTIGFLIHLLSHALYIILH